MTQILRYIFSCIEEDIIDLVVPSVGVCFIPNLSIIPNYPIFLTRQCKSSDSSMYVPELCLAFSESIWSGITYYQMQNEWKEWPGHAGSTQVSVVRM